MRILTQKYLLNKELLAFHCTRILRAGSCNDKQSAPASTLGFEFSLFVAIKDLLLLLSLYPVTGVIPQELKHFPEKLSCIRLNVFSKVNLNPYLRMLGLLGFFTMRVVKHWHNLPRETVDSRPSWTGL